MPRTPDSANSRRSEHEPAPSQPKDYTASADEQIRQMEYAFESSRSQLEYLEENLRMLDASLSEYARAQETLENYGGAEGMLMPVGAGVFIISKPAKSDKAIVSVGAGASVEMTAKDAIEHIGRNAAKLNAMREKVSERVAQIKEQMKGLAGRMESLYGSMGRAGLEGKSE